MRLRYTLKFKLIVSVLLIMSVTYGISSFVIYHNVFGTMEEQIILDEQQKLEQTSHQLEYVQESVEGVAKQIVILSELQNLIKESRTKDSFAALVSHDKVRRLISSYTNMQPYLSSVIVITPDGKTFSSNQYESAFQPEEEAWYQEFKAHNVQSGFTTLHSYLSSQAGWQSDVISYVMTFKDIQNGRDIMGDLIIHVDFKELIAKAELDDNLLKGYALYDRWGNKILGSGKLTLPYEAIAENENGKYRLDNGNVILCNRSFSDGWIMVSEVYSDQIGNKLSTMQKLFLMTFAAAITLLVVLIYYFINRITRPVGQLHAAAEKVRTGDFDIEVDIHTNDELEILGDSFNSMVQDLQNLLEESVEHEKNIREMEINRLMLQINPHFIYNTLNSIVYMAQMKGDNDIVKFANAFISLLQDTLRVEKDSIYISMRQEVKNIRNYLTIQEYRYPDRFQTDYQIDEDVLDCEVPNVLIQPIVENAIFHGLAGKIEPGRLCIQARREEECLVIRVVDDGIGMSRDKVEELLASDEEIKGKMRTIGVANVSRRIAEIYGDGYGLQIVSEEGVGTRVTVTIPYRRYQKTDEDRLERAENEQPVEVGKD
ncbi:MAG: histidine kinase [Clostridium sp.]|nr:histidine kinase [Clostridium sp.]